MEIVIAFVSVLLVFVQASVVALGGSCAAKRPGDYGVACATPIRANVAKACAVTAEQRRTIAGYYDRTSLHHRAQLRYAFPRGEAGDPILAVFLQKPVSGTPDSYEVLNVESATSEALVYERCGNMVHSGAPYRI